jgi:farnesyl diphosphate synthase
MNLEHLIETSKIRVEKLFDKYFDSHLCPAPLLQQAMSYAVLNGGKRIRPLLVYATGHSFGAKWDDLDGAACAIELIHSFSLIHDDLPAMDNSDLRRGKASCHKAFNEPLAILAGDSLQSLAFEVIVSHPGQLTADQRLQMIKTLSYAGGLYGMAGGQALDLAKTPSLLEMYHLKTGALLIASIKLGAIAANVPHDTLIILEKFAKNLGLAFQIQDDLLDTEESQTIGKPQGLDIINDKSTYPIMHGVLASQEKINELMTEAFELIKPLGNQTQLLQELTLQLLQRKK